MNHQEENWFNQSSFNIRLEWGLEGARRLSPQADVTIVVDVLSFSTCVDVGVSRGAKIYPFPFKDARLQNHARNIGALAASPHRSKSELCLSPRTLNQLMLRDKLILPSPNGSAISHSVQSKNVLCGCLRNAQAMAKFAETLGPSILVIAAGEKWGESETLRPCIEDLLGAGSIISALSGTKSPEALVAASAFESLKSSLLEKLNQCSSGQELNVRKFPEDIEWAAQLNVSESVPILKEGYFVNATNHYR